MYIKTHTHVSAYRRCELGPKIKVHLLIMLTFTFIVLGTQQKQKRKSNLFFLSPISTFSSLSSLLFPPSFGKDKPSCCQECDCVWKTNPAHFCFFHFFSFPPLAILLFFLFLRWACECCKALLHLQRLKVSCFLFFLEGSNYLQTIAFCSAQYPTSANPLFFPDTLSYFSCQQSTLRKTAL